MNALHRLFAFLTIGLLALLSFTAQAQARKWTKGASSRTCNYSADVSADIITEGNDV